MKEKLYLYYNWEDYVKEHRPQTEFGGEIKAQISLMMKQHNAIIFIKKEILLSSKLIKLLYNLKRC